MAEERAGDETTGRTDDEGAFVVGDGDTHGQAADAGTAADAEDGSRADGSPPDINELDDRKRVVAAWVANELRLPPNKKTLDELARELGWPDRNTLWRWRKHDWWGPLEQHYRQDTSRFPLVHLVGQLQFLEDFICDPATKQAEKLKAFEKFVKICADAGVADRDHEMEMGAAEFQQLMRQLLPDEETQQLIDELIKESGWDQEVVAGQQEVKRHEDETKP